MIVTVNFAEFESRVENITSSLWALGLDDDIWDNHPTAPS